MVRAWPGPVVGLLLALLASSCDQSANRVSTLWTNVPEVASAVERFNASQREWQLLVEYVEDPAPLLGASGRTADLVIARGLATSAVKGAMGSLDFLFDRGQLAKALFYHRILDAGQQNDRLKLLPISFDLPVLVYSQKVTPGLSGFSLSLDEVRTQNTDFDAQVVKGQRRIAFSPSWDGFGPTFLEWSGVKFQEGFQGGLTWDSSLTAGLGAFQGWPSPQGAAGTEFQRKYLQGSPLPALVTGRVQFYPSTLSAFLTIPWKDRRDLDFRFLDLDGRVLASEGTVWAGIPSSSLTRGAGEQFLAWFFQPEVQKQLIEAARNEDDRNFGLAQGLSSLVGTNESALLEAYPHLAGKLPGADQVVFWAALPGDWQTLKSSVLKPWLDNPAASETSLRDDLERHRLQAARR